MSSSSSRSGKQPSIAISRQNVSEHSGNSTPEADTSRIAPPYGTLRTFVGFDPNIRFKGERDIQTKVMTTTFALFAEVERDLISERTREGLVNARASARKLGRPKRSLAPGVSRLDGKKHEIRQFLELGVSKTAIAKITGVSWSTLNNFMATRSVKLKP